MKNCNVTYPGIIDSTWNPPMKQVRRVTKTIEKYDCEGRYLGKEVIIEEYEDVYVQDWITPYQPPYYIGDVWCGTTDAAGQVNGETSALSIN